METYDILYNLLFC